LTLNYRRIKIYLTLIKANLILEKIRLNIPFNFSIARPFHLFLQAPLQAQVKNNIYKDNNVIKNIKCPIVLRFEFLAKLFGQELLGFGQPNLI